MRYFNVFYKPITSKIKSLQFMHKGINVITLTFWKFYKNVLNDIDKKKMFRVIVQFDYSKYYSADLKKMRNYSEPFIILSNFLPKYPFIHIFLYTASS